MTQVAGLAKGCDDMARRQSINDKHTLDERTGDGPMLATFWRKGKFVKLMVSDVSVAVSHHYAEIILRTTDKPPQDLLFVVSDDPDVGANMSLPGGDSAAFDGFLLRDNDGSVIERVTVNDSATVH